MAILNSLAFFIGIIRQPPGFVYLGTVHYWEDYFFYLNHFFQGAHGAWLTANRFTSEPTSPGIIYWTNILMGKIGALFGLNPVLSYNVWLFGLCFFMLFLSAILLSIHFRKSAYLTLTAFIFTVLSSSLQNRVTSSEGTRIFWPFQLWKTPHFSFDRLGGAPHQMIQTILFYVLAFSLFLKLPKTRLPYGQYLIPAVFGVLLSTINPVAAITVIGSAFLTGLVMFILKKPLPESFAIKFIVTAISSGLTCLYMLSIMNTEPHIQTKIWEAANQNFTTWPFLAASIGPIIIFILFGVIAKWKSYQPLELFSLILFAGTYIVFMSPVPARVGIGNIRFLFPATYLFMGLIAASGLSYLAEKLVRFTRIKYETGFLILLGAFVLLTLPTNIWELYIKYPKTDQLLTYLPRESISGLEYLSRIYPYDDVALGNPATHLDTLIPPFSGHTSYSGHILHTIKNSEKQFIASQFYALSLPDPVNFLKSNKIKYVLFSKLDGDQARFEQTYPYLDNINQNPEITLYRVKE